MRFIINGQGDVARGAESLAVVFYRELQY